ncbi:MAG: septum formation initiator family protein [Spirochaetales bacterium]|nr:septum formation initiator family protein [Spirochaetales bacterium]
MKLFNLIVSIYLSVILSALLVFFFGEQGLIEYNDLSEKKRLLSMNIEKLKEKNQILISKLNELNTNSETIKLLARELGYYGKNEDLIRIQGYKPQKTYYNAGSIIKINLRPVERNFILKIISLLISLIFYVVITIKNGIKTRRTRTQIRTSFYTQ